MKIREYCPDCVIELKKEKLIKKLVGRTWKVCPKCGYRVEAKTILEAIKERNELIDRIEANNAHWQTRFEE